MKNIILMFEKGFRFSKFPPDSLLPLQFHALTSILLML
jgi:hypothetical protein